MESARCGEELRGAVDPGRDTPGQGRSGGAPTGPPHGLHEHHHGRHESRSHPSQPGNSCRPAQVASRGARDTGPESMSGQHLGPVLHTGSRSRCDSQMRDGGQ